MGEYLAMLRAENRLFSMPKTKSSTGRFWNDNPDRDEDPPVNNDHDYQLDTWNTSELLKEACRHLREEPQYVQMKPEAKAEMISFCHAVRRELMGVQEHPWLIQPAALFSLKSKFNLPIFTDDYLRYRVLAHDYTFTIIMDVPVPVIE